MRQSFTTQPALFAGPELLDHPALKALDAVEALFDWPALEALMVADGKKPTGRPGYPAQTLLRRCFSASGTGFRTGRWQRSWRATSCSASSAGWRSTAARRTRRRSGASGRSWRRRSAWRRCSRR
jgi:hypothetical protein